MESLYAPWREAFIKDKRPAPCIFCPEGMTKNERVLFRGKTCLVFMNLYPYTGGHLLVAPNRHVGQMEDLTPEERTGLFDLLVHAVSILERELTPDGFNVGINLGRAAGAGVPDHLHIHIVPRWTGDTNFMCMPGNTRVISEDLDRLRDRLLPFFAAIKGY